MAEGRRIVVTGMGAVSALGTSLEENWDAAKCGRGGIHIITLEAGAHGPPPQILPLALVGQPVQEQLEAVLGHRVAALDPTAIYAVKAVHEALQHAGLLGHSILEHRTSVVFGQGNGGSHTLDRAYERFYGMKSPRLHPLTVPRVMVSAPVSAITMEFHVKGPAFAVSSACSSSGHSVSQGAMMIRAGLAEVAIVGGSEAIASPGTMRAWEATQAISATTCRPFSIDRDGTVVGEGAAALVLESLEHANARGAAIYGELRGVGMSSDAFHWTQPSAEGAVTAMRQAWDGSGVAEGEAVLIASHGTGTALNDKNEAGAIHTVFDGRNPYRVIATKSAHGHLIGASTALQTVLGLKALEEGTAPPILNFLGPDPECDLDLVTGEAQATAARILVVNAFAFGGLNTSLVFAI